MSAIVGMVWGDGRAIGAEVPGQLIAAAPRRACDGVAVWREGPAVLVQFRHATTPEAITNQRQLRAGCSGTVMCFDGRLDNRPELLALLGGEASHRGAPDSDIALALLERFGDDFLSRLVGDYALAAWHPDRRKLLCARSPIGWRPLHWSFGGSRFGFASDARTLVLGLDLERQLNEGLAAELLSARVITQTETLWRDVHRLEQGCALIFEHGEVRLRRWHDERFEDSSSLSDRDHVDRFNELFDQALVSVTRSNTGIAAHLSGGLDSSSIVARATELHRSGRIDRQIAAVSVRYPGEPQDETDWSIAVERHLGIEARIAGDLAYDLEAARTWCANTFQLPVRPNTMGPTQSVCASMRERGERVLLTGEGGDDWLNGSYAHWPDLLLRGRLVTLLREGFASGNGLGLRSVAGLTLGPILSRRRRLRLSYPNLPLHDQAPSWIRPEWAAKIGLHDRWENAPLPDLPSFSQRQRYSMMASPNRQMIFDPIQASAADYGVELRHPFHDLRLVRFLIGARGDMLRRGAERKHLLREAMRGTLPEVVRARQSKAHFSAPIIDALTGFFEERAPQDMFAVRQGWIDGKVMRRLFEEQGQWRRNGLHGEAPNGALSGIWSTVAFDLWVENALKP